MVCSGCSAAGAEGAQARRGLACETTAEAGSAWQQQLKRQRLGRQRFPLTAERGQQLRLQLQHGGRSKDLLSRGKAFRESHYKAQQLVRGIVMVR